MNTLTSQFKKSVHSFQSHSEIKNLITSESDTAKAYENLIKQKDESSKLIGKWAMNEPEFKNIVEVYQQFNTEHSVLLTDFLYKYKAYVQSWKSILQQQEKIEAADKTVKEIESKVAKQKATESSLRDAKSNKEAAERELESFKEKVVKENFLTLTKAYYDLYSNGIQLMTKQMQELGRTQPFSSTSSTFPPKVPPKVNYLVDGGISFPSSNLPFQPVSDSQVKDPARR